MTPTDSAQKLARQIIDILSEGWGEAEDARSAAEITPLLEDVFAAARAREAELRSILADALSTFRCTQKPEHYPADHWSRRALALLSPNAKEGV